MGVVIKLWSGQSGVRNPDSVKEFSLQNLQTKSWWCSLSLQFSGHCDSSPREKRLERKVDPSTPSSAEKKNERIYTSTPLPRPMTSWSEQEEF
jgi:hypothetical protein